MTKQQHTPEQLDVFRENIKADNGQGFNVYVNGMHVGSYTGPYDPKNIVETRARLIAAAPELLEALERVRPHVGAGYSAVNRAPLLEIIDKAVAKARGE